MVFCAAEALVYAYLAACMPRSGGEYYFQARILSTGTGSVFCFSAIVLGGTMWVAVTGWCAAQLAVGPLLVSLGVALDSASAHGRGGVDTQPVGGARSGRMVVIVWSAVPIILGMGTYARWQRWFSRRSRRRTGHGRGRPAGRTRPRRARRCIGRRRPAPCGLGYAPEMRSRVAQTLAIVPLASYMLVYAGWSTQQAGETRDADRLRAQVFIILGAMLGSAALSALVGGLVAAKFGARDARGRGLPVLRASRGDAATDRAVLVVGRPLPRHASFAVVVAILFNALFWMNAPNPTLAASRVLMAMSSDRILPRWVGHLHSTTKAPVKAIVLFSVLCVVPCALYSFTQYWRLTLNTVALVNILAFAVTCATGALFPFVRRELYRETAASRYELLGVPVITLAGAAFVAFTGWIVVRYTVDFGLSLGLGLAVPIVTTLVLYAVSFGVYLVSGLYRRARRGTELEVWFTESPLDR